MVYFRQILLSLSFILISCRTNAQDIFEAARTGNIRRLEALMKLKPDTIHSRNESGFTPLIIAGYRNQLPAVEFLLENGADVNATSPEGTVLLGACYKDNLKLAEFLISHHADVNAQNETGTSALMFATLSGNLDLVKLLLKHGAKKTLVEKSGKTALSYAQMNGSPEVIRLLSE
jgi:ankyrin repeat protein